MKLCKVLSFVLIGVMLVACCLGVSGLPTTAGQSTEDETKPYYLSANSNVDTIHATTVGALPCIGQAKILVFYVDFQTGKEEGAKTREQVEELFFSETAKHDPTLAYSEQDSVRSYYYRSSYGKVDITGSVYEYQSQKTSYDDAVPLLNEIIAYYQDIIPWDEYDGNNDGYIDGIYLVRKIAGLQGGDSFVANYTNTAGNLKIAKMCFTITMDLSTICHETCHMFGPADMYATVSVNPNGIQTACIMENGLGDLPSATKFVLGWLDNAVFVSASDVGTYQLRSYSHYGDALIIYPDGDPTNRNWFFAEYVTSEGNNRYSGTQGGLRVWKTQMNLDADYNINGAKEFCEGTPESPYAYLEAVHPDNVWNYYLQAGQEITPYTYPSTAYSDTFYNEGGAKMLKDLTFSGIDISFTKAADGVATVDVQIEKSADLSREANATVTLLTPDRSSLFLDNKDLICFASLVANRELKITDSIQLLSPSSGDHDSVETKLSKNQCEILLYISPTVLRSLQAKSDWEISVSGVKTYYGAPVRISQETATIDFSEFPTPLLECDGVYNTGINLSRDFNLICYTISDSVVLSFYYNITDRKLYWAETDTVTNTTSEYELPLPDDINMDGWTDRGYISVWRDADAYFVQIYNYVCCYRDRTLVAARECITDEGQYLLFRGGDEQPYFVSTDDRIYRMVFSNGQIAFEKVNIELPGMGIRSYMVYHVYSFVENRYIVTAPDQILIFNTETDTVQTVDCVGLIEDGVFFENGYYYVFTLSQDLKMYKYDTAFRLVQETCVLKDLVTTMQYSRGLHLRFYNQSWIINFEGVSYSNAITYDNTFLVLCAENGEVISYYRYGNPTYRYVCQFVPLSPYKLIGINPTSFLYVRTECEQHTMGEWTCVLDPTCVKEGQERRDCQNCNYFETRSVQATGQHVESAAVTENREEATCTNPGGYDSVIYCTVCHEEVSREHKVLEAKGHTEAPAVTENRAEATCTADGSYDRVVYCSVCHVCLDREVKTIDRLGHCFTNYHPNGDATYTEDGTMTAKCDRCNATDTQQDVGSALGLIQKFRDQIGALPPAEVTEKTYQALYAALQTYAALTTEEQAAVSAEYEVLGQRIADYNAGVQSLNSSLADATKIGLAPIMTCGFTFAAALWYLLSKRVFMQGGNSQ